MDQRCFSQTSFFKFFFLELQHVKKNKDFLDPNFFGPNVSSPKGQKPKCKTAKKFWILWRCLHSFLFMNHPKKRFYPILSVKMHILGEYGCISSLYCTFIFRFFMPGCLSVVHAKRSFVFKWVNSLSHFFKSFHLKISISLFQKSNTWLVPHNHLRFKVWVKKGLHSKIGHQ